MSYSNEYLATLVEPTRLHRINKTTFPRVNPHRRIGDNRQSKRGLQAAIPTPYSTHSAPLCCAKNAFSLLNATSSEQ